MAKKPEEKTLGQIKNDIKKGETGKEAVAQASESLTEKKPLFNKRDFVLLLVVLVLFALGIIERSRVMATVAGVALILVIMKIAYGQYTNK